MLRLVLGLLITVFQVQLASATTAPLKWLDYATSHSCDRAGATTADGKICEQAKVALCREHGDSASCSGATVNTKLEERLSKKCDPSVGTRAEQQVACQKMYNQMKTCCMEDTVGNCLDEIGGSLDLKDAGDGSGLAMLCSKASADMDEAAKANAAVAGTCSMRSDVWSKYCLAMQEAIRTETTLPSDFRNLVANCAPVRRIDEVKAQLESLLKDSEIAKTCHSNIKDPNDPGGTPPGDVGGGTTSPQSVGGMGGGMDMLGAALPMIGELLKSQETADKEKDEEDGEDVKDDIAFENTTCDPSDANCVAKKLVEGAPPVVPEAGNVAATNSPVFNPPAQNPLASGLGDLGKAGEPASNGSGIPGGGGGGIPGGGGGGGMPAAPNTKGGGGPGASTDIMHGYQGGGGYSAMNAAMSMTPSSGGGFRGYGGGGEQPSMDLAQFLPNGAKDPRRKLAGQDPQLVEIQSKDVNLFNRVSERFKSRCVQGLLRDCIPN